ncbi:Gldg family protein [Desertibaculum subflavum]|uniref:Gldg family protein n=1 Tax=Desertibaculum subflavum TaxID=2268458 RepID=UPI000E66F676
MNRTLISVTGLVIAAILFLAVNILANLGLRTAPRIDLTEQKLYTLSEGTRNVLASIQEPITLRLFYSAKLANDLPQIKAYGQRVRDLLEAYASRAGGKIRLEVIDPEPYTEAEDRAVAAGVQGAPLDANQATQFYFGLVGTNTADKQEVIPFLQQDREQFLEYDLTRLVYTLTDPKKPVLGLLTDIQMQYGPGGVMAAMRGQGAPYILYNQLKDVFQVKTIATDVKAIDDDVTVLMIVHPKALSEQTQYAIDQFVMRGGRVVLMVDPHYESEQPPQGMMGMQMMEPKSSNLPKLMQAWGVAMDEKLFVGDRSVAIRVNAGEGSRRGAVDYVAWMQLGPANRNPDDVTTGELGTINLISAGALKPVEGAGTTVTPLLYSSKDQAALIDVAKIAVRPQPDVLLAEFKPSGERYTLAARISGPAKSAFPDGPPPPPKKEGEEAKEGEAKPEAKADEKPAEAAKPHLAESKGPINVVVVADVDMIEDRFWVRVQDFFGQRMAVPFAGNADLLVNAVDSLSGSNDLITLRSRGRSNRPFEAIDQLRREAGQEFVSREQELQKKLQETEKQIAELQSKRKAGAGGALLSAEEQAAIDNFRKELIRVRRELRDVQYNLNRSVERLAGWIKFANIGLVPIVVAGVAIGLGAVRRQRRSAGHGKV